jgi:hypothetical protein
MAWMTKTVFVKGASVEALADAIVTLLGDEQLACEDRGLLGNPPPVRLSPAHDGWVAINGLSPWLADLLVASERLSLQADSAVSFELIGNSLRLRCGQYIRGERRHLLASPEALPWGSLDEHGGPMPRYDDVEDKAFRTLRALGIPAALLGIDLAPLGAAATTVLGQGLELIPRGESNDDAAPQQFDKAAIEISGCSLAGDAPPALPREASRDFGVSLFDDRYVEGRPTGEAVDRLLEIEEQWEARARRAVDEPEVSLTITYHGGTYQEQLDELLRARGRYVPPTLRPTTPPWWAFWKYFGAGAFRRR